MMNWNFDLVAINENYNNVLPHRKKKLQYIQLADRYIEHHHCQNQPENCVKIQIIFIIQYTKIFYHFVYLLCRCWWLLMLITCFTTGFLSFFLVIYPNKNMWLWILLKSMKRWYNYKYLTINNNNKANK